MKVQFIFLLVFCTLHCIAQYQPIATGCSPSWLLKHEMYDMAKTQTLFLGDTITLHSQNYKKAFIGEAKKQNVLIGYFREDCSLGKAWFRGINDSAENLLLDLNLKEGDSIFVKMYGYPSRYAKIISIEKYKDRKKIITDFKYGGGYINEYLEFIEGIGPNASLLYQVDDSTANKINSLFGFLVCKEYCSNKRIYAWDTIHFGCGQMYKYTEEFHPDGIMVYPNPKSYKLKVTGQDDLSIEIYNTAGKCVLRSKEKEILIDHLKPQIYVVKIVKNNKVIHLSRITIETNKSNERE